MSTLPISPACWLGLRPASHSRIRTGLARAGASTLRGDVELCQPVATVTATNAAPPTRSPGAGAGVGEGVRSGAGVVVGTAGAGVVGDGDGVAGAEVRIEVAGGEPGEPGVSAGEPAASAHPSRASSTASATMIHVARPSSDDDRPWSTGCQSRSSQARSLHGTARAVSAPVALDAAPPGSSPRGPPRGPDLAPLALCPGFPRGGRYVAGSRVIARGAGIPGFRAGSRARAEPGAGRDSAYSPRGGHSGRAAPRPSASHRAGTLARYRASINCGVVRPRTPQPTGMPAFRRRVSLDRRANHVVNDRIAPRSRGGRCRPQAQGLGQTTWPTLLTSPRSA